MNQLEAQAVHGALATALNATERAVEIVRELAPPGITPLALEAADRLSEATVLASRAIADAQDDQRLSR